MGEKEDNQVEKEVIARGSLQESITLGAINLQSNSLRADELADIIAQLLRIKEVREYLGLIKKGEQINGSLKFAG